MTETTEIHDLVGSCVVAVEQVVGVRLDGTPDTLPLLDHYAKQGRDAHGEVLSLVAPMCGAYFSVVVQNTFPRTGLDTPADDYESWRLHFDDCSLAFNPVGIAVEVMAGEQAPGWGAHFQTAKADLAIVESALAVYGDVRENDYYTFSVRFEALEQVVNALARVRVN